MAYFRFRSKPSTAVDVEAGAADVDEDNWPLVAGPDQTDEDSDGKGDACD